MAKSTPYRENLVAALGHVLRDCEAVAPHTGKPWSDAMLFGLSGGAGHGYILWQFEKSGTAPLVLNFVHRWNYPQERFDKAAARCGLQLQTIQTSGAKKAQKVLDDALSDDVDPLIAVDWLHCPFGWLLQVQDRQADGFVVQDTARKPYQASKDYVADARAASPSFKHRLHRFDGYEMSSEGALARATKDAIDDAVAYQTAKSASFGLAALKKWQRLLTDQKNDKGWPVVFGGGANLAHALLTVYQRPLLTGSGGTAMRGLYADFLREADGLHGGLAAIAPAFDQAGAAWQALAQVALPIDVPDFASLRKLAIKRAQTHAKGGALCVENTLAVTAEIEDQCNSMDRKFPLSASDRLDVFSNMADALENVIACEQEAISALQGAAQNL